MLFLVVLILLIILWFILPPENKKNIKDILFGNRRIGNRGSENVAGEVNQNQSKLELQVMQLEKNEQKLISDLQKVRTDLKEVQRFVDSNTQAWHEKEKDLMAEINDLKNIVSKLKNASMDRMNFHGNNPVKENKSDIIFAKNFGNGILKPSSTEDAQFEIYSVNGRDGSFEYCGSLVSAKANVDSFFDGACLLNGSIQSASKIITLEKGKAVYKNGKWSVIKKATIKFK